MKDNRWVPFWLPFLVFGFVGLVLFGLGMLFLNVALATGDLIPGVHSGGVIIVALTIGAVIAGAAAWYARTPSNGSSTEHGGHSGH